MEPKDADRTTPHQGRHRHVGPSAVVLLQHHAPPYKVKLLESDLTQDA